MIAVSMESGNSITLTVLDKVSIRIIKLAPRLMLMGITYLLLLPTNILAQWGINSPIQPTCPHMDTQDAVMTVEVTIKIILIFFIFIPLDLASSSLKERIFSLHLSINMITVPSKINGEPMNNLL